MIKYNERRIFMVFTEKFDKLCEYESCEKLSEYDIDLIYRLSYDTNSFIRALSAETLAKIPNERSKSILFRLANDRHCFVRTEAYDSLSAFSDVYYKILVHIIENQKLILYNKLRFFQKRLTVTVKIILDLGG